MVLELCECSLRDLLVKNARTMSLGEALPIICDVMRGLIDIHSQGLVHRDIKLENILLAENRIFKIADFGLATTKEQKTSFLGTIDYMAPEIVGNEEYNYKVDLWAMAVMLFLMLFGVRPFSKPA
jgi:serine/threonine protein kinase